MSWSWLIPNNMEISNFIIKPHYKFMGWFLCLMFSSFLFDPFINILFDDFFCVLIWTIKIEVIVKLKFKRRCYCPVRMVNCTMWLCYGDVFWHCYVDVYWIVFSLSHLRNYRMGQLISNILRENISARVLMEQIPIFRSLPFWLVSEQLYSSLCQIQITILIF